MVTELDLRGLKCPLPVLRTRKALRRLAAAGTIEVLCTDPLAAIASPISPAAKAIASTHKPPRTA